MAMHTPGETRAERCALGDHEACLKGECEAASYPSFDPFWVRNLVERVGRELHDLDMLAADVDYDGANQAWSAGHREGFKSAAKYLTSAIGQSVERLGLAAVLAAARAGATPAELAAIPQNQEG